MAETSYSPVTPRLIIHGGAGNITRHNLPPAAWKQYRDSLLSILDSTNGLLSAGVNAVDVATHAVSLLEDDPLFNASHGAVFTRAGTNELEASVMVSRGKRKRGCAVTLLKRVKHPILLAKKMLLRGDDEDGRGGGAYQHVQLSGAEAESLAASWGLDLVDPRYFYTQKRWDEHLRGLDREKRGTGGASWDVEEYVPQGTVGAVALDKDGTLCVATSTGGITNKLPGRVGDTPTLGAGFWAQEWTPPISSSSLSAKPHLSNTFLPTMVDAFLANCLPSLATSQYAPLPQEKPQCRSRAVAMSGTGNGDSFLRLCACHTVAALTRFSSCPSHTLQSAMTQIAGPGGELQALAGDRWGKTGEGEGGMIGIDLHHDGKGQVVADFNCGGLFRTWIDERGKARCMVFRDEY